MKAGEERPRPEEEQPLAGMLTVLDSNESRLPNVPAAARVAFLLAGLLAVAAGLRSVVHPWNEASTGAAVSLAETGEEASASSCAKTGTDCRASKCCEDAGQQCYEKNPFWATCRPSCTPGVDPNDKDKTAWTCNMLFDSSKAWDAAEGRARAFVKTLKPDEKAQLLRGQNDGWPHDRHGFAGFSGLSDAVAPYTDTAPPLMMNDGPQGFNGYGANPSTSTQLPCLLTVAASWNPEVSRKYATAIAEEFVVKGANVLLGPDVEVTRVAITGRGFETISGEDPYLGSKLVQPFVKAVQDHGIISVTKHFLDNNQEIYRQSMNVEVEDRAQYEIYTPVFKAAFEAGAAGVMCSYNKVYNISSCENPKLLTEILREGLGFRGFVVSDWGATHDAVRSANAGLDIDMQKDDPKTRLPDEFHKLPQLVKDGTLPASMLDDKAAHVLASQYLVGQMDGKFPVPSAIAAKKMYYEQRTAFDDVGKLDATSDAHRAVAFETIVEGAVLLKNEDGALPLVTADKKIAMLGRFCKQTKDTSISQGDVFSGGGSGYVTTSKVISPFDGFQGWVKDAAAITWSGDASAADGAEVAIVCAETHSEEGWDRANYSLPEAQWLVEEAWKHSSVKKVIVLAFVPGAVTTEWIDKASAALLIFMPGEQVGPAVAQLLTGDQSPGGRLPVSLPRPGEKRFETAQYPGVCKGENPWCPNMTAHFDEGVLVGYRWNDAKEVPSAFPFGHGLTYTDFEFKNVSAECKHGKVLLSLTIENAGDRDGAAVPQIYVGFPSLKPVKRQLRGFRKIPVEKGGRTTAVFALDHKDWSFYDEKAKQWTSASELGEAITFSVGTSSVDFVWNKTLHCKGADEVQV